MFSNAKANRNSLMVAVIPIACVLGSVPFFYAIQHRSETETHRGDTVSIFPSPGEADKATTSSKTSADAYTSRLRLYQTLSHLTSRAQKNGGKVTITKEELKALARDLRAASE